MRLTSFTDFGLRALMRLAEEPQRQFTTEEIASELRISRNHLTKVVRDLANAGVVETQRGAGGGFKLARPADQISLGDVVRHLEGRYPLVDCLKADGGTCVLIPRCRLKSRLVDAAEAFLAELDRSTLADCMLAPEAPAVAARERESQARRRARGAEAGGAAIKADQRRS